MVSAVLSNIISESAPLLGTVLAGAPGGVIGSLVASIFGGNPNDHTDLINRIQADTDAQAKLKKLEQDNIVTLQQIAMQTELNRLNASTQQFQVSTADIQDARNKFMELHKSHDDGIFTWLAFLVSFEFFMMIALLTLVKIDLKNPEFLYMLAGQLAGAFTTVVTFYFGSSYRSAK